jgi:hypothetical protein
MRHSLNRDDNHVFQISFRNGWTASVIFDGKASACAAWPTCRGATGGWIDHVHEAADNDEVAEFLVSVRRRSTFTPHYYKEPTPHIPSPSDESISGGDIRRELDKLNRKIDIMALNLDRITAAVAAQSTVDASITTLLTNVVAALKDVSAKLADALAQNDPAAQAAVQAQLDGLAAQIESQNSTLVDAVNANTPAQPAPVETPAEAPVQ